MRKLFILAVGVLFVAYCYSAHNNMVQIDVPQYEIVELDILGGKTLRAWEEDQTYQTHHLIALERRALQPTVEGLTIGARTLSPQDRLKGNDYKDLIAAQGNTPQRVTLRDPAAIHATTQRRFLLRDPIELDGKRLEAGQLLDKNMIDQLIQANISKVTISGKGEPVAFQPGSLVMVMLIFLALVAALKGVLWDPVLQLVDERSKEIEEGAHLLRDNRTEAARLEIEGKRLRKEVRRAYLDRLAATQREALKEADTIYNDARVEAQLMRDKAQAELHTVLKEARAELKQQVPELAATMVEQVLGRKPTT